MEKDDPSSYGGGGQSKNDGPYDSQDSDDDDASSRTRKSGAAAEAESAKKGKPKNVKAELIADTNPSAAATTSATMAIIPNKNVSVW